APLDPELVANELRPVGPQTPLHLASRGTLPRIHAEHSESCQRRTLVAEADGRSSERLHYNLDDVSVRMEVRGVDQHPIAILKRDAVEVTLYQRKIRLNEGFTGSHPAPPIVSWNGPSKSGSFQSLSTRIEHSWQNALKTR